MASSSKNILESASSTTTSALTNGNASVAAKKDSNAKLRGHPNDSQDVRFSKTLSYILRHGAAKEGLKMRTDGFIRVDELVRYQTS